MKTFFDCVPCFMRQALESIRRITSDEAVQEKVLREVFRAGAEMDLSQSPPAMGQHIHRVIRKYTGQDDPYREVKDRFNRMALDLCPTLETWVERAEDPFEAAVKLAIAGNIIDLGAKTRLDEGEVHDSIANALSTPLEGDLDEFVASVQRANRILYLADNAGEIVFDRLLVEQLSPGEVTVVVRGFPVINDATIEDALAAGIDKVANIIDNGSDAPGTILDDCSEVFREQFDTADLIIAKGQGNYETLSDVDKNIYFLLKAKCPVIARHIDCRVGAMLLLTTADIHTKEI